MWGEIQIEKDRIIESFAATLNDRLSMYLGQNVDALSIEWTLEIKEEINADKE